MKFSIGLRTKVAKLLMGDRKTYTYLLEKIYTHSKEIAKELHAPEIALRIFTPSEKQTILNNYEKSPEHLKKMISAVLMDHSTQSLITQPVYSKETGEIYPASENIDQFVPCNSLIKVLEILLKMTDFDDKPQPPKNLVIPLYPDPETPRAYLTEKNLKLIEIFYKKLGPVSQAIFDLLCRNSAGNILFKPVFLPDGYIYEEMTAKALAQMTGRCHINSNVACTKKDIIPCHFVIPVLEALQKCAEASVLTKTSCISRAHIPIEQKQSNTCTLL